MSHRSVWSVVLIVVFGSLRPSLGEIVPFDGDRWAFAAEVHEIVNYKDRQALYLKNGLAFVDDLQITNGVIEFDIAFEEQRGFSGALWRMTDRDNFEEFYLRHHQSGNPDANQYTPIFNASAAWQLYYGEGYAKPIQYEFDDWMHVKIQFSGKRAEVYIDSTTPSLKIYDLKHFVRPGKVGLMSNVAPAYFSNFAVSQFDSDWPEKPSIHESNPDLGMIKTWQISLPFRNAELDNVFELDTILINSQEWRFLTSESDGITNLAKLAGIEGDKDTVFARAFVESQSRQKATLRFGYSDNAKVFVNKDLIYEGTNTYKSRDYRYLGTIGLFDSIYIDLQQGINEIVFAIQEDFGGWGVLARIDAGGVFKVVKQEVGITERVNQHETLASALDARLTKRASEDGFTGSVVVSRGGEVVLNRTYDAKTSVAHQSGPAYWIASGTKQFTGALIALLAHDGALDLDAKIGQYLNDVPPDKQRITIRQLLTHTSGLGQRYAADGVSDRDEALRKILRSELAGRPGEEYSYSNDGFNLLAIIAEIVTDQTYEELIRSRLFDPAKMVDSGFWGFEESTEIVSTQSTEALKNQTETIYSNGQSRANWGYRGATGMYSTARDLHAWLIHVMKSRDQNDNPLSHILNPEHFIRDVDGIGAVYYGFGLAVVVRDGALNMISHNGDEDWLGHSSTVSAYTDGDVIVVLSNAGYLDDGTPWSAQVTNDIRKFLQK